MPTEADPIVDNWYQHLDKGQKFKVVAIDETAETVEIQHFDGDLEEIDLDLWTLLDLELIAEPEDWTGPLDGIDQNELGYVVSDMQEEDWADSMREIKTTSEIPTDEAQEMVGEDWGEGFPEEEPWEEKP